MRIIGLYGHGGCGKSATMNFLKELLRDAGDSISSTPHPNCEAPETFKYKGLTICVAPGGDNEPVMLQNVDYFKKKRCDIAIVACRCKGAPVDVLNRFALAHHVEVEWMQKSYEYNLSEATHKRCNKETAQFLLNLI